MSDVLPWAALVVSVASLVVVLLLTRSTRRNWRAAEASWAEAEANWLRAEANWLRAEASWRRLEELRKARQP